MRAWRVTIAFHRAAAPERAAVKVAHATFDLGIHAISTTLYATR